MNTDKQNMSPAGQIQIADEVIAVIAGTAAMEVEGVEAAAGASKNTIAEFFGKKSNSKGVKVFVNEGEVSIEIDISIKFGIKINDTALEVQKKIKNAVENMTGLSVTKIDVNVSDIVPAKQKQEEI
ncbi:MAG: Asp23/Gls24 family envelope stress response protein [Lachnospiraceae bacterium]|nr:Asp23/Gls24 family envelope stress response protein [Lachnospiraceae bacterium]